MWGSDPGLIMIHVEIPYFPLILTCEYILKSCGSLFGYFGNFREKIREKESEQLSPSQPVESENNFKLESNFQIEKELPAPLI